MQYTIWFYENQASPLTKINYEQNYNLRLYGIDPRYILSITLSNCGHIFVFL